MSLYWNRWPNRVKPIEITPISAVHKRKTSSLRQFCCIQFSARLSQYCSLAPQQSWSHVEQHGAIEMMVLGHIHNISMIGAQQALLLCMTRFVKSCEQWLWSNRGMGTPWPRNHKKNHRMQIPFPWLGKSDNFYLFLSHKSWLYNFAAAQCCFVCRKVQHSIWTCCEHPLLQGSVKRKWKPHAKAFPIWIHLFRPHFLKFPGQSNSRFTDEKNISCICLKTQ